MKKKIILLIISTTLLLSACNQSSGEVNTHELQENTVDSATSSPTNDESSSSDSSVEDYSDYVGLWSTDGSHITDSGAEFNIEIQGNEITNASLYTQTSSFDRFAEVDNITGTIIDGTCTYEFTDDGWDNSGTLLIQLKDNTITIDVEDFVLSEDNVIGYGINGHYDLIKVQDDDSQTTTSDTTLNKYNDDWTEEQMLAEIDKRSHYKDETSYYPDFLRYKEVVRECTDISVDCYPLFNTDTQYYQATDFENVPPIIIHLAKNEIYARHGYIFTDEDLNNFYLTQLWYLPEVQAADFDDSVFNEYEKYNLELLSQLDTY